MRALSHVVPSSGAEAGLSIDPGDPHVFRRLRDMTDLQTRLGKFTSTARTDEVRASSWIARHPRWTLAIGILLLAGDIVLALKAYG
jgi:hypothetical protein